MAGGFCAKCRAERAFETQPGPRGTTLAPRCTECGTRLFVLSEPVPVAARNWCAKCRSERDGSDLEAGRCAECGSRVFGLSE